MSFWRIDFESDEDGELYSETYHVKEREDALKLFRSDFGFDDDATETEMGVNSMEFVE